MSSRLQKLYSQAQQALGPQGWWPAESPFEVIIGAILTQNTNWSNVEKALQNLKDQHVLEAQALYEIDTQALAQLIRPSGYYKVKAQRLKNFLHFFYEKYQASIEALRARELSELRSELLSIHGIGPETADSILLYALEKPIFVIDAYTHRIWHRHNLVEETASYHDMQELAHTELPENISLFNEFHALIVKLGKSYCKTRQARCELCPLKDFNWEYGRPEFTIET